MRLRELIGLIALMLALTGCKDNFSSSYLLQHPAELKKEVLRCQTQQDLSKEATPRCQVVLYAAATIMSLINEVQEDPEKFGQRILASEIGYVKAKETYQLARQTLEGLKNKHASAVEMAAAEKNLVQAKNEFIKRKDEMKTLLAVIGLSSPE